MPYIGRDLNRGNYLKLDDISSSFNSSTKTFNLTVGGSAFTPGSAFSILVSVGGVIQEPESAYQVNNSQITFANAPTAQDGFFCIALGTPIAIGVPGNGTVNGPQMAKPFNYDGFFYLNDANNRVGINSSIPKVALDVIGNTNISGNANISGILTASSFSGGSGGINAGVVTCTGLDLNGNGDVSGNFVIGGDLTVNGTTSTIDTNLIGVDRVEVGANSNTLAGIAVTQSGLADLVRLYDGATNVLTVTDTGDVGIRKPVPGTSLHVRSTATGGGNIAYFDDTGSGVTGRLMILTTDGVSGGGIKFQTVNKKYTYFGTSTNKLTIDNNNSRVGIGSDIPTATLDVIGTVKATNFVGALPISNDGNNRVITATGSGGLDAESNLTFNGSKLVLAANSTAYDAFQVGSGLFIGNTTNNVSAAIFHQGGGADLEIGSQDMITFTTGSTAGNATERLRIDSNGRIGLGITNPSAYFSSYNRVVMGRTNDTGGMTIVSSPTSGGYIAFAKGTSGNQAYRGLISYAHSNDSMRFSTDADSPTMVLDNAKRVGIGTDSPDTKVEIGNTVSGTANLLKLTSYTNSQSSRPALVFWNNNPNTAQAQISAKGGASYNASKLHFAVANSSRVLQDRACIDEFGTFIIGPGETRRNTKGSNQHQVLLIEGNGNNSTRMSMIRSSNDDNGPEIQLIKTRGNSIGSVTKPNQNDYIGSLVFLGGDDSDLYSRAAEIAVQATGVPANDRIPSDIIFSTTPTSGATSPQEALRITSEGRVGIDKPTNVAAKLNIGDTNNDGALSQLIKLGNDSSGAGTGSQINLGLVHGNESTSACIAGFLDSGGGTSFIVKTAGTYANQSTVGERLRITSGGQVRIGNTDITVQGAADDLIIGPNTPAGDHGITIISGTSGTGNIYFADTNTASYGNRMGTISYYHNDNYMRFSTNGNNERLRITSSGSVGINTTSPSRKLVVVDNLGGGIGVVGSNAGIYMGEHHTGGFQNNCAIARAAANNYHISGSTPGDLCIAGESTKALIFGTSAHAGAMAERIRIQSDGKIGIFDNSPVSKVTINNGTGDSQCVQIKNDNVGIFFGTYGTGHASYPREATINGSRTDSGSSPFLRVAGQGGIKFCVDLNSERMRIDSSGRVSIGDNNAQTSYPFYVAKDLNSGGNLLSFGNTDSTYSQSLTLSFDSNKDMKWLGGSGSGGIIWDVGTRAHSFKINGTEKFRINNSGGIQISEVKNVSANASNTTGSFNSAELILTTPAYAEYHYTWSGHSSYTIDLTCASYFHSEFIYVQHQTNGGTGMQSYIRGKWANNHQTHTCQIHEWYGVQMGLDVTFVASDQSGNGAVNGEDGLTDGGWSNASYRGKYGGGGDKYDNTTSANGRLRITETYNWGSVSSRALIVRVYFGSFNISKS